MKPTSFNKFIPSVLSAAVTAALLSTSAPLAQAADGTWTNAATGGLWSDSANWLGGTIADGSGFAANFSTIDISADNTVHLDSSRTLGSLAFGDAVTATAASWIVDNNGGANTLTLAGGTPTISVGALGTASTATISAEITGASTFSKTGVGALVLSGPNSYTGVTTLSAGTLTATQTSGTPFGTGSLALNGGVLQIAPSGSGSTVALTVASAASQVLSVGGGSTLAINKGANTSVTVTAGNGSTGLSFGAGGALVIQPSAIANLGGTEKLLINSAVTSGTAPAPVNTASANLVGVPIVAQASSSDTTADFLRYDPVNGFVSAAGSYNTKTATFTTSPSITNTIINSTTANQTFNASATVAGLRVTGVSVSIGNATTRTAVIGNNAAYVAPIIINGGTIAFGSSGGSILNFGASQGAIYTSAAGGSIGTTTAASGTGAGKVQGSAGMLFYGPGTLTLFAGAFTSYSGTTTVASGTLLLGGAERLANASNMSLSGGTFATGGFNETVGTLTLASSSTIDLGAGASILKYGASNAITWTGILNIYNYTGTSTATDTDQLFVGTDGTGLTTSQLNSINFYSDAGTTLLGTGSFIGLGQVGFVAVPEPATVAGGALLLGMVGWSQRRNLRSMVRNVTA